MNKWNYFPFEMYFYVRFNLNLLASEYTQLNNMSITIKKILITSFLSCLIGCSTNRLVIPNGSAYATNEITAPETGSFWDDVGLGLAGPVVCESFFIEKHAVRKAIPVLSVNRGKTKSANIPAGKDTIFVISQNIEDRNFYAYWEMYVKHNSSYRVKVINTYSDKRFFGKAPNFAYEVYEDGKLLPIMKLDAPQVSDCD